MKAKRNRKLNLSLETVRRLNGIEMAAVAGGATSNCTMNPRVCTTSDRCTESCGPISVCICA